MKKYFTIFVLLAFIGLSSVFAQIPTDSLVGYYPFNGNANDASGNGNNGTVNGATLCPDRFGNANSAYSFDGVDDYININSNVPASLRLNNEISGSAWIKVNNVVSSKVIFIVGNCYYNTTGYDFAAVVSGSGYKVMALYGGYGGNPGSVITTQELNYGTWYMLAFTGDGNGLKIYINGVLDSTGVGPITPPSNAEYEGFPALIGKNGFNEDEYQNGILDDIRIYKRALDSAEIHALYNDGLCYETITVTDTLIINYSPVGYNPVTFLNTIKIYPNPTNDHITVDYGNYSTMSGYTLKITNSLVQTVFTSPVNQQQSSIDLSTWTGNGIYFVHLIDAQNNTIDIRKIILQ